MLTYMYVCMWMPTNCSFFSNMSISCKCRKFNQMHGQYSYSCVSYMHSWVFSNSICIKHRGHNRVTWTKHSELCRLCTGWRLLHLILHKHVVMVIHTSTHLFVSFNRCILSLCPSWNNTRGGQLNISSRCSSMFLALLTSILVIWICWHDTIS